jgi:hypothetical protein
MRLCQGCGSSGGRTCRYSVGRDRPRGSKPRSPGRLPSSHAGRSVLGSHRPSSAITAAARQSAAGPWPGSSAVEVQDTMEPCASPQHHSPRAPLPLRDVPGLRLGTGTDFVAFLT